VHYELPFPLSSFVRRTIVRRTGVRRTECAPIVVLNPSKSMADKDARIKFATASYCEQLLQDEELL